MDRDKAIDDFVTGLEYEQYNIAHLVLDDRNTEDDSIQFALKYIEENRKEYLRRYPNVTDGDIDKVVQFLSQMLSMPDTTTYYDD